MNATGPMCRGTGMILFPKQNRTGKERRSHVRASWKMRRKPPSVGLVGRALTPSACYSKPPRKGGKVTCLYIKGKDDIDVSVFCRPVPSANSSIFHEQSYQFPIPSTDPRTIGQQTPSFFKESKKFFWEHITGKQPIWNGDQRCLCHVYAQETSLLPHVTLFKLPLYSSSRNLKLLQIQKAPSLSKGPPAFLSFLSIDQSNQYWSRTYLPLSTAEFQAALELCSRSL